MIDVGLGIFSTVNYILSLWTGTTQPRHVMLRSLREYCYLLLVTRALHSRPAPKYFETQVGIGGDMFFYRRLWL